MATIIIISTFYPLLLYHFNSSPRPRTIFIYILVDFSISLFDNFDNNVIVLDSKLFINPVWTMMIYSFLLQGEKTHSSKHIRMDFILSEVFHRHCRKSNHKYIEYVGNINMTHRHNFFNLTSTSHSSLHFIPLSQKGKLSVVSIWLRLKWSYGN